jgi:S1-C subfamily serine protease
MDQRPIPPRPDIPYPYYQIPQTPQQWPPPRRGRAVLAAILAALLVLGGLGITWNIARSGGTTTQGSSNNGSNTNMDLQAAADKVEPAVVDITTYTRVADLPNAPAGTDPNQLTPLGAATGMVLTSSGEVLTNNHVVEGAWSIEVTIPQHPGTYKADVVGVDPSADVALIQLQGVSGLPTVSVGDSSAVQVGQEVIAIGNALGKGGAPTVTAGSVSDLDRSITATDPGRGSEHLNGLIQTDAQIRPGDSGGALVSTSGQVIGMITAGSAGQTSSPSSTAQTAGFAIPTNDAMAIISEIRAGHGSATIYLGQRGFLGVQVETLDPTTASQLGVSATSGALVRGVVPGGPADAAGITPDSVIVRVNDVSISSADDLGPTLHVHAPGDSVQVTWVSGTKTHTATVTLTTGPAV